MMIKEGDAADGNLNKTAPNIKQAERSQNTVCQRKRTERGSKVKTHCTAKQLELLIFNTAFITAD